MWLLLGVVVLLTSLVLGYRLRVDASWRGSLEDSGEFHYEKSGDKPRYWRFGVAAPGLAEFRLKPQGKWDGLFQKLRISNEVQTGDHRFDRLVYVISDVLPVRQALQIDATLRQQICALFDFLALHQLQLKEMRLANNRLWLRVAFVAPFDQTLLRPIAERLRDIVQHLPTAPASKAFDPYVLRAAAVLALSSGLAISGVVALFSLLPGSWPAMIGGRGGLWATSFSFALPLIAVLLLGSLIWLKRSSRTHLILLELLLVGSFGVWAWTYCGLRDANMRFDTSPAEIVVLSVSERIHTTSTSRSRKGRSRRTTHHYSLRFDRPLTFANDPGAAALDNYRVSVSSGEYNNAKVGDRWGFTLHRGRLGWPWVESGARRSGPDAPAEGGAN